MLTKYENNTLAKLRYFWLKGRKTFIPEKEGWPLDMNLSIPVTEQARGTLPFGWLDKIPSPSLALTSERNLKIRQFY